VAVRICPHCKTELSAPEVASRSDNVECPKCNAQLEVVPGSRTIASVCGLVAGAVAWRLASDSNTDLGGVLPTLYAFLAFGVVSPLVLMFTANLHNAPAIQVSAPTDTPSAAGHGAGGHH
jgi:hypothetical protein